MQPVAAVTNPDRTRLRVRPIDSFPLCADPDMDREAQGEVRAIVREIVEANAPYAPVGLILTGSFARGEGVIVRTASDRLRWLSDVEFLLVVLDRVKAIRGEIAAHLRRLCEVLSRESDRLNRSIRVDISHVFVDRLGAMSASIFAQELCAHGKLVWGDPGRVRMPRLAAGADLRRDALRLLNNRLVEHTYQRALEKTGLHDPLLCTYSQSKMRIELATSLSVFLGCYRSSYAERATAILPAIHKSATRLPPDLAAFVAEGLERAMTTRSRGLEVAVDHEREFADAALIAEQAWWWETGELLRVDANAAGDWRAIPARLRAIESAQEGVVALARSLKRNTLANAFRSLAGLLRYGSPATAIYSAGCILAFRWGAIEPLCSGRVASYLCRLLNFVPDANADIRSQLAQRVYQLWYVNLR